MAVDLRCVTGPDQPLGTGVPVATEATAAPVAGSQGRAREIVRPPTARPTSETVRVLPKGLGRALLPGAEPEPSGPRVAAPVTPVAKLKARKRASATPEAARRGGLEVEARARGRERRVAAARVELHEVIARGVAWPPSSA